MRIGILGGTFDPVHIGHLRMAEEIGEDLALDKVYLVPGGRPPHKKNQRITPFKDRLAMARSAVRDSERLDILDLEGRREGPSYSIETLEELYRRFPSGTDFFFLIGVDAFLDIKTWKEYRRLFDYTNFAVFNRPGFEFQDVEELLNSLDLKLQESNIKDQFISASGKTISMRKVTSLDISSTSIRRMARQGRSIRFLVTGSVREYILKSGLYRANEDT